MKTNKGYTLIEMIIVIAIMAILTGVAFVTLNVIKQAKCSAAVDTFQNQISSLWIKTKSVSQSKEQSSPSDSGDMQKVYPMAMKIVKNTDSDDDVRDGSYEMIIGFFDGSDVIEDETVATLTDIISIDYIPASAKQEHSGLTVYNSDGTIESVLIQFNKSDGSVKYGAGSYEFTYNGTSVAKIRIDAMSGNHYVE